MKYIKVELRELQQLQLRMFEDFRSFLDKNNISYFFLGGSCLGAIRHKGFIPWDDDIDIGVLRKDYEKILQFSNSKYEFHSQNIDLTYPMGFTKLCYLNSRIVSKTIHFPMKICIDIFPLDYGSSNIKHETLKFKLYKFLYKALFFKNIDQKEIKTTFLKFMSFFRPLISRRAIMLFKKLLRRYKNGRTLINYYGAWGHKEIIDISIFGSGKIVEFEGSKVKVPLNSDKYLSALYGDYMTLPPTEKRKSHHGNIEFFINEKDAQ